MFWYGLGPPPDFHAGGPIAGGLKLRVLSKPPDGHWTHGYVQDMRRARYEAFLMPRWLAVHDYGQRVGLEAGVIRRLDAPHLVFSANPRGYFNSTLDDYVELWRDVFKLALEYESFGMPANYWLYDGGEQEELALLGLHAALRLPYEPHRAAAN